MSALMPQVIGIFSALFKKEGYTIDLFDATYYKDFEKTDLAANVNEERVKNRNAPAYSYEDWGKKGTKKKFGIKEDFIKKVQEFEPDLILVSVLESTYFLAMELLNSVPLKDRKYKTMFGGVFATFATDKLIKNEQVDYVCRGEGEDAVIEMCRRLCNGERIDDVRNFTLKGNDQIYKNPLRPAVDLDTVPIPDWDLFDPGSIYRPMQGKIWRVVGLETQRGCPYTCAYCNSPSNNVIYKSEGNRVFYRKKSIARIKQELDFLVKKYNPDLIYMVVDTFLAMSSREWDEFKELYMDYKIPFWMNTRAETITPKRAQDLEDMNLLRMNIGIEHGNYQYRKDYLKRIVTNELQIKAFEMLADKKYTCVANSIVGLPDETRELIFDTIKLVRQLPKSIDATGAFIFAPYHGTPLRDLAIQKGYVREDEIASASSQHTHSMLRMPTISPEEISGLARVYSFYVKFPENRWDEIKIAEKTDKEGNAMFKRLGEEFDQKYRQYDKTEDLH
jgi:anaerobic magnesium-protoporphyrin IX monomethyl ester cyclase